MNTSIRNTFIIPFANDYLVYSPLTGISALINKTGVLALQEQIRLIEKNLGNHESKLYELALEISHSPMHIPSRKTGSLNPDFLGIIPTRSCNGACNYCDFGAEKASSEKMSYNLAVETVNWYVELIKSKQRNIVEIHFFGGEPMVARDVIEVVVQRARLLALEHNLSP